MSIRIVRLGSAREKDEGPRIGTVRRPPRGVPKSEFARGNWYDVWYPNLAPRLIPSSWRCMPKTRRRGRPSYGSTGGR